MRTSCAFDACEKSPRTRGLCSTHYNRQLAQTSCKKCSRPGCAYPAKSRDLCSTHYNDERYGKNRQPKVIAKCAHCGNGLVKDKSQVRRYANVFCDQDCHTYWRWENDGFAKVGGRSKPREPKPEPPRSCVIYARYCVMCSSTFVSRNKRGRLCSAPCRERERAKRRAGRHKKRRVDIFERDAYRCWMCDMQCDEFARVPALNAATVDHITPRSLGGTDDADNLATACFSCNSRRGNSWAIPTPRVAA